MPLSSSSSPARCPFLSASFVPSSRVLRSSTLAKAAVGPLSAYSPYSAPYSLRIMRHFGSSSSQGASSASSRMMRRLPTNETFRDDVQEKEDVNEVFYERGPAILPPVPREEDRIVLTPIGDRQWKEEAEGSRVPNGIVGLLVHSKFLGIVNYRGKDEAAVTWRHYNVVPAPMPNSEVPLVSALQQVEDGFWQYFKWPDGKEAEARKVLRNVVKKSIESTMYEAQIRAVIGFYRKVHNKAITRTEACRIYLKADDYMKKKPGWVQRCPEAWRKMANSWASAEWIERSKAGRKKKEKMGGPSHRQGSASLCRYQRKMAKVVQKPVSEIEAYVDARKGDKEGTYCSKRAADRIIAYADAFKEIHGDESDWEHAPIDPVAVYKAGHGKPHGRFLVCDGLLNTKAILTEVRASESDPMDDARPRQQVRSDHDSMTELEELVKGLQSQHKALEQQLLDEHQEHAIERAYLSSALLAIQEQLGVQLPPRPQPRSVPSHPSTTESVAVHITEDVANGRDAEKVADGHDQAVVDESMHC